jgi:hypothetical protein
MHWNLWDDEDETIFERQDDHLVYRSGVFDEDLVEELKDTIPSQFRRWDGELWHIDLRYTETVVRLHCEYIGEVIALPEAPEEFIDASMPAWINGVDQGELDTEGEAHDLI